MATKNTTTTKKKIASAKSKAAPKKKIATAKASVAKRPMNSIDDHTLLTQTLVFVFAMLSIVFVAMTFYAYS